MKLRRGQAVAVVLTLALVCTVAVFAQDDKKQKEAQRKEIQGIVTTVDAVASGQPTPNDLSMTWVREDVLKAQGNKQYVPFTVTLDPSKVPGGTVAFYWRVVAKGGAAEAAPAAAANGKKDDKNKDTPRLRASRDRSPWAPAPTTCSS
jgi:hypothetical protein